MLRSLFDRREQRLKKLAALIGHTPDRVLLDLVERSGASELSLLLRLVPMARMNPLMERVPLQKARDAFQRLRGGVRSDASVDDETIARVASLLTEQSSTLSSENAASLQSMAEIDVSLGKDPVGDLDRPVCVRALDLAGRVLGGGKDGT